MKKVILKEKMPFMYKGTLTWYDIGTEFEVVKEAKLKMIGLCYKVKKYGCIFDGWRVAKNFEDKNN